MAIWTTKIEIIASWIEFNSVSEHFHGGTNRTFNRSLGGGRIYLAEKHGARFRNIYFLLAASESLPGRPRCGELVASRVCVLLHVFSQTVSLQWRFEPVKIVEQKGNSRIKAITAEKKIIFVRLIYILARNTREFHQIRCISSFKHNIRNHWRHIYIRTTQNKYQHLLRCEDFHEYPYICTINRRHYWLWYISVTLDSITQVKSEILLRKIYSQVRFVRR